MSTPQLVGLCEIVRGVDVEEQELRIAEIPDVRQREDTDRDALVEADGAEVARLERGLDGLAAGRTVGRTERLDAAPAAALGEHGVASAQPGGEGPHQRDRHERHVPGDADDRGRGRDHRGEDPAQRAQARPHVGHDPEVRAPGRRIRRVGHQQRRRSEGVGQRPDQAVQDPLAADRFQALGAAAEPGGAAPGQHGAARPDLRP